MQPRSSKPRLQSQSKSITQAEIKELAQRKLMDELPHIYGLKHYDWSWRFFTSTNRFCFLCSANQVGKSSSQIRKVIDWATDKTKWQSLWRTTPRQFWYLYPSRPVSTTEYYEKWVPEFLPRGSMINDPQYGWEPEFKGKEIWAIHFKSGVSIYFKSYEMDAQSLQTSSAHYIAADEELPYQLFHEIRSRLTATHGYFSMVFTATLGQLEWKRTMEPANPQDELFPKALKIQVSMYDCLTYRDGSKSFWTPERIREIELECATENEVQRRVFGRFVVSSGLKYPTFDRKKNLTPRIPIPDNWHIYTGVDIGSGGEKSHPAAIAFIAVRPDYKLGIVFKGWRGDGVSTTSADVLEKHTQMLTYEDASPEGILIKKQLRPVLQSYDWHNKDFFQIASRAGIPFTQAQKQREAGQNLLNTLFKLRMLLIMDDDPELSKLVVELTTLTESIEKTNARDDFIDAIRYAAMPIPWDFDGVAGEILKVEEHNTDEGEVDVRDSGRHVPSDGEREKEAWASTEAEFAEWQSYVDG